MAKVLLKSLVYLIGVVSLLSGNAYGQSNPLLQHRDIVDKEFHYSTVNSAIKPVVIGQPEQGHISFESNPIGEDLYRFEYNPGKIEANTKAVIEYWTRDSETGELKPDYTTFTFRITRSLVTCNEDRRYSQVNNSVIGIDVLSNDGHTHGPLTLENISYVEHGLAIANGNKIDFHPEEGYTGEAFVYYTAKDSRGKVGVGILKLVISSLEDLPEYETRELYSYGGEVVELPLPFGDFVLENNLSFGKFEVSDGLLNYSPYGNRTSSETLILRKDNLLREFTIHVVEEERPNSWVIDDIVYTSKATPVTFDVEANDLKKNLVITDYSSDLEASQDQGVFTYEPESFFTGSKTFEYTVYNGYESETGQVHLKVNNFYPQNQYDYNFRALSNSALIIEYLIPINNFSFELLQAPQHGNVSINTGTVQIDLGCTEISGTNLVLYEPNFNYKGNDIFRLNYCVDGQCEEVEVKVEVVDNNMDGCQCYTGCVWAGDANNDGLVNVVDLLSIAYSIGTAGAESDWNGGSGWIGRTTEDWIYDAPSQVNAKYADSDGNGIVDEMDFDAILDNYDRNHALVPPQLLDNKSYAFTIQAIQDTVYIGDRIEFEIGVGNSTYPALDVHGLAYSLGLPSQLVDSSSVALEYYNDSWLAVNEAVYGIYNQVSDGWIETSVARMGTHGQSGAGDIGKLSFIVEEDVVGGFRIKDGILPLRVSLLDGKAMTQNGELGKVKGADATAHLNIKEGRSDSERISKLIAFPNPANERLNLHMNGGHDILSYEVFDLLGQKINTQSNLETRNLSIPTHNLNNGTYVLKVMTTFGPQVTKVEVVKN